MNVRSLLTVALLAPAVAFAAPASGTKSRSSTTPAAKSAPASSSSTAGSPLNGLEVGGFLGYETDDISGVTLRLDGEIPFRTLTDPGASTQVKMSWVGSLGYSHLTRSEFGVDFTANMVKVVPAARFTIPLNPQFSVFGDAGLGLAYISAKVEVPGVPGFFAAQSSPTAPSTS